jgi:hypothetical protein
VVLPGFIDCVDYAAAVFPLTGSLGCAHGLPRRNLGGAEMKTGGGGDSFSPVENRETRKLKIENFSEISTCDFKVMCEFRKITEKVST